MSDLKSKQLAVELLTQTMRTKRTPSAWHLWLGVLYPAAVIAFELATRWCAQTFFDPMPTMWHVIGVAMVPVSNLYLWLALREKYPISPQRLALVSGLAIGVAGFYTLVFLPLIPLAVVAIVIYGLGLLPLAPLVSLISALRLTRISSVRTDRSIRRPLITGMVTGLALLVALDIPAAATRLGVQWAASTDTSERSRGLSILRTIGDEDLLLRLCYDAVGRPSGLLSAFVMLGQGGLFGMQREFAQTPTEAREIYYRAYGQPFNAKPAPFSSGTWARFADFQWDADHGGTTVGGRIKGLDLLSSRIDGSISAADAVGYIEWVVEFRNTSPTDREARMQFALPPGGVVSRATLWINGEEQEAAYGGRGVVRAAYQKVAVQQRRDPLLVTTKGADRVLAQAFPVPRDGGTIKFKIGITAPLALDGDNQAKLVLPAILDRNFSVGAEAKHSVWLESKTPLTTTATTLAGTEVAPNLYRISGTLDDASLAHARPTISVKREPTTSSPLTAQLGQGAEITQQVVSVEAKVPGALMIVVDGSARVEHSKTAIARVLDKIPDGAIAGIAIASETGASLAPAPWTTSQKAAAAKLLAETPFVGGQDNTKALAASVAALEPYDNARLVWVHGPQPVAFRESAGALEQAAARLVRRPQVALIATEPGPNEVLPDVPWGWTASSIPPSVDLATTLAGVFTDLYATVPHLEIKRGEAKPHLASDTPAGRVRGSDHIARLWARDRILQLMSAAEPNRADAVALASEYKLVTPVSGAVVLETQQQYEESRLLPTSELGVPTVPEPEEWALIILAAIAFLWLMRIGQRSAAAPC